MKRKKKFRRADALISIPITTNDEGVEVKSHKAVWFQPNTAGKNGVQHF
jgi:hypothetical protein